MDTTLLSEINFSDEDLSKCFYDAAEWIAKNNANITVRDTSLEHDDEWGVWYLNIIIYGAFDRL